MKYSRLVILIALVGSIITWSVFIIPRYLEYTEIQAKVDDQKAYLDNQTQYFAKITEIENQLQQSAQTIEKINTAIPNGVDFATLVTFFEKTGKETGVIVKNITIGSQSIKTGQERLKENRFYLALIGTYPVFRNFLYKIQNSARLFEVDDISFAASKANSEFFNYNVKLRAYSY